MTQILPVLKYFAIKHRTEGFLAHPRGRGRHKLSNTQMDPGFTGVPRLFTTRRGASIALTAWVKGHHSYCVSHDWEGGYDDFYVGVKDVGRKREDMEIVEVEIVGMFE